MNMKKRVNNLFIMLLVIVLACNNVENKHQHSNVELEVNEITDQIISPAKLVLSRQATINLEAPNGGQVMKSEGYIDFDRTRNQSVSARLGGRIEKLYVKYDLQFVKKGEKILELYSPELNTFQEAHLFLLKTEPEKSLVEKSRQKLKLIGLTDNQVALLEKNRSFTQAVSIYSPADGYVSFNSERENNESEISFGKISMNNMGMNAKNKDDKTFGPSDSRIREGMYLNKGETLFTVNDLQNVWAIVSVSSEISSVIKEKSEVKIISELFPDTPIIGKIALIEQAFEDSKQRFARMRIDLPNLNGMLKLYSLVSVDIPFEQVDFQIPTSAIYRTGLSSFVWVKTRTTQSGTGIFQLRKVGTGLVSGGMVAITRGLSANEEIAKNAAYLTDSETFLNEN